MLGTGPGRVGLLIGHGGDRMAARLVEAHPDLNGRLTATGTLPPADVSRHLQACDLMIQTYPDGVSSRRTSLMAALAHGVATVTSAGRHTEPVWAEAGAVGLARGGSGDLSRTAERLLSDHSKRHARGRRGPRRTQAPVRDRAHGRGAGRAASGGPVVSGGAGEGPGYVLVTGDFVTTGGMDRANHALALYLARLGRRVELVAHRVDASLLAYPTVRFQRVPKPLNSYWLAEPLLARAGRVAAARRQRGRAGGGQRRQLRLGRCQLGPLRPRRVDPARGRAAAAGAAGALSSHGPGGRAGRSAAGAGRRGQLGADPRPGHRASWACRPSGSIRSITAPTRPDSAPRPRTSASAARPAGMARRPPHAGLRGRPGRPPQGARHPARRLATPPPDPRWDARLAVVGTGSNLGLLKTQAAPMGGAVEFLGFRADVPEILRGCDALVSPSRYEAYGLNVHEALCCGLPALVVARGGSRRAVPGRAGRPAHPRPGRPHRPRRPAPPLARRCARYQAPVARLAERLRATTWDDMAGTIVGMVEAARAGRP